MSRPSWHCVITGINQETLAQRGLAKLEFETYLPRTRKIVKHARKIEIKVYPLFSRYLFLATDKPYNDWSAPVRDTDGVEGIITNCWLPVEIPCWIIDEIKAREAAGAFDQKAPLVLRQRRWIKSFDKLKNLLNTLEGEAANW